MPARVERNTERILELFDAHGVRATFFVLGWIAERYPSLVRRIAETGHEVASHGFEHVRVTGQSPAEFARDAGRTRALLEDVAGVAVVGFRAASFSIGRDNLWALEELARLGYRYSSSIYPVRHDLYGIPEAPRFAFRDRESGLLEVPVSTLRLGKRNLPCGGGGYFRLLPYRYFRWAYRRLNDVEHQSVAFYFHPWEIDPEQPRLKGLRWKARFRHYTNLARTEGRLEQLLSGFGWGRYDEVFTPGGSYPEVDLGALVGG